MIYLFSLTHFPGRKAFTLFFALVFLGLASCDDTNKPSNQSTPPQTKNDISSVPKTCTDCHSYLLDQSHNFPCEECHLGTSPAASKELAHSSFLSKPASPANMSKICGRCHKEISEHVRKSKHFTLQGEVNVVRRAFGASADLAGPEFISQENEPKSLLALSDDMLRRRCLRCHVYSSGDAYSGVTHGQGCAACHLKFSDGSLTSHAFTKEADDQICLSCHYGNYVGADYYGRFEHDFSWEYQTPFEVQDEAETPYGVNYHQLRPDIHKSAGMSCIDCHHGNEIMATINEKISCLSCHRIPEKEFVQKGAMENISKTSANTFTLFIKKGKKKLEIPQMKPDNHTNIEKITCQVCHAQWSFSDYGTHLMRIDNDNYSPWIALTKQGSSEAEQLLDDALFYGQENVAPSMRDKFTGENRLGLWLKGYELRRWEDILTCFDSEEILHVCRPILDMHLSYVDSGGNVLFDSVAPPLPDTSGLRPYSPHTIGKAGILRRYKKNHEKKLNADNPLVRQF